MSKEKVEQYKNDKKNKNKKGFTPDERKEKIKVFFGSFFVIAVILVGLSIPVVQHIQKENATTEPVYTLSQKELESLMEQLNATTAAGETTKEGETTKKDETTAGETKEGETTAADTETTVAETTAAN